MWIMGKTFKVFLSSSLVFQAYNIPDSRLSRSNLLCSMVAQKKLFQAVVSQISSYVELGFPCLRLTMMNRERWSYIKDPVTSGTTPRAAC